MKNRKKLLIVSCCERVDGKVSESKTDTVPALVEEGRRHGFMPSHCSMYPDGDMSLSDRCVLQRAWKEAGLRKQFTIWICGTVAPRSVDFRRLFERMPYYVHFINKVDEGEEFHEYIDERIRIYRQSPEKHPALTKEELFG